jgi:hypothetical protein
MNGTGDHYVSKVRFGKTKACFLFSVEDRPKRQMYTQVQT